MAPRKKAAPKKVDADGVAVPTKEKKPPSAAVLARRAKIKRLREAVASAKADYWTTQEKLLLEQNSRKIVAAARKEMREKKKESALK